MEYLNKKTIKNNNQFLNTNRVGNDGVDFYGRQRNTFAKANSYITFADKEPFGIKEWDIQKIAILPMV